MLSGDMIAACAVILFLASIFRSVFGFGDSLVAMPLLVFFIPLQDAVVIGTFLSLTLGLALTKKNFNTIVVNKRETTRLIVGSIIGIIPGALLLKMPNTDSLLILFGTYLIVSPLLGRLLNKRYDFADDRHAHVAGFLGGFFGGLFNTNGPPVLIYGNLRKWTPLQFASVLQPFFVLGNIIGLVSYLFLGVMSLLQIKMILIAMPGCLLAIYCGEKLARLVDGARFSTYTNGIIMFTGIMILVKAITI